MLNYGNKIRIKVKSAQNSIKSRHFVGISSNFADFLQLTSDAPNSTCRINNTCGAKRVMTVAHEDRVSLHSTSNIFTYHTMNHSELFQHRPIGARLALDNQRHGQSMFQVGRVECAVGMAHCITHRLDHFVRDRLAHFDDEFVVQIVHDVRPAS